MIWLALMSPLSGLADTLADIVRIHREAIGGERLEQCRAITARGVVRTGGREVEFDFLAARPNRLRLAMRAAERTLVQATDGITAPWLMDSSQTAVSTLAGSEAKEFMVDAEFDDPLVSLPARGFVLDYAGEADWEGKRVLRVLVTRTDTAPSFLLVDPDTYFIVVRQTKKALPSGREILQETVYDDFRPVAGVIYAHRVTERREGRVIRETILNEVRQVPEPAAEVFVRPFLSAPPAGEPGTPEEPAIEGEPETLPFVARPQEP